MKKIINIILILIIGFIGGLSADIILPYLGYIDKTKPVIVNKTEQIIISESEAPQKAIDKISPSLVLVEVYNNKFLIKQGTGIILTSDGLVATALDLLGKNYDQIKVIQPEAETEAQVIKKDSKNNLALLKIEKNNLAVASTSDLEEIGLGQTIILVGLEKNEKDNKLYKLINLGSVRGIKPDTLEINLEEKNLAANGGPLLNIKGEVIGLSLINQQGLYKIIPSNIVKEMLSQ